MATAADPYCTPADVLVFKDYRLIAQALQDTDGPVPSRAEILDATGGAETPGRVLLELCRRASGELETACVGRGLYTTAELTALATAGGNMAAFLKGLLSGVVLFRCAERRQPTAARFEDVPGVKDALDTMERIRVGERSLGTAGNVDAGTGMSAVTLVDTGGTNERRTVNAARRFFGRRMGDDY